MKKAVLILALAVAGLAAVGLARLELDVDVFGLLPADSEMVDGMKLYQESFASPRGLILSLRSTDAESTETAARSLAEALEGAGLTPHVIWQSPFHDDLDGMAELLAYLWLNRPPEEVEGLAERFVPERLPLALEETFERMATSLRPREVARLAHDPYGLGEVADRLRPSLGSGVEDPFTSADGTFRVLFALQPFSGADFWRYRDWTAEVRDRVEAWRREAAGPAVAAVRVTGNPAFIAETGSGLLADMEGAALGTLVLIAGLFWLVHRRWAPLAWLVVLLVAVLAVTAGLGSFLSGGKLNAMSLGFAAILLGLAVDYALILYQELVAHPGRTLAEHRAAVAPSVLWAAVTTAGAFFMIGRSSLPGLTQLGTLVGLGTLVAAGVMLLAFLPPLAGRLPVPTRLAGRFPAPTPMAAAWITGLTAVAAATVLAQRLPAIEYDTQELGPKEGLARLALEEIEREIGGFEDSLWLLADGADEGEVAARLARLEEILEEAAAGGLIADFTLPEGLWPIPEHQAANRETVGRLAGRLGAARAAAVDAGFTDEALLLTEKVFAEWERFAAADGVTWPERPGPRWVFDQFAHRGPRLVALGRLTASDSASNADLMALTERVAAETGARLLGWSLIADSLLGVMERDVKRVLVPMAAVLLVLLALAFRRPGEVLLSLVTLGFSLACLLGAMTLFGWSWNLMNIMSLPLLFGAGVDYSIHIQLALKRYDGDVAQARQTVGRAILLCGLSTAAGFTTLAFASNAGLASLGRVSAAGIALTALVSVLLLPAWWRVIHRSAGPGTA